MIGFWAASRSALEGGRLVPSWSYFRKASLLSMIRSMTRRACWSSRVSAGRLILGRFSLSAMSLARVFLGERAWASPYFLFDGGFRLELRSWGRGGSFLASVASSPSSLGFENLVVEWDFNKSIGGCALAVNTSLVSLPIE